MNPIEQGAVTHNHSYSQLLHYITHCSITTTLFATFRGSFSRLQSVETYHNIITNVCFSRKKKEFTPTTPPFQFWEMKHCLDMSPQLILMNIQSILDSILAANESRSLLSQAKNTGSTLVSQISFFLNWREHITWKFSWGSACRYSSSFSPYLIWKRVLKETHL